MVKTWMGDQVCRCSKVHVPNPKFLHAWSTVLGQVSEEDLPALCNLEWHGVHWMCSTTWAAFQLVLPMWDDLGAAECRRDALWNQSWYVRELTELTWLERV